VDAKTFFSDVKLDNDTQKVLQDRFSEVSKTIETLQADANAHKERFEGSVSDRDKAKARVKELEDRIRKGDFDGAKELRELNEKLSKDFETTDLTLNQYKSNYEKLEKDFKAKSKELDEYVTEAKKKLLENIPDNLKEVASRMNLKDLNEFYSGLSKEKIITDKTIHPGNNGKAKPTNLAEWKKQFMK